MAGRHGGNTLIRPGNGELMRQKRETHAFLFARYAERRYDGTATVPRAPLLALVRGGVSAVDRRRPHLWRTPYGGCARPGPPEDRARRNPGSACGSRTG